MMRHSCIFTFSNSPRMLILARAANRGHPPSQQVLRRPPSGCCGIEPRVRCQCPVTGPVLAGCSAEGKTVTVRFNSTLLAGETVVVGDYNATAGLSGAAVLTNASLFCMEPFIRCVMNESTGNCTHVREWYCPESTSDLEALRMHNQILDEIERLGGRYQLPRRCRSIPT